MEIKELAEEMQKTFKEFKEVNDEADKQRKESGKVLGETTEKLEKMNTRFDELETKMNRHATLLDTDDGAQEKADVKASNDAFVKFMRKSETSLDEAELKSLAVDDSTDGGFLQPRNMRDTLIKKLIELSPVRELANVETISKGDSLEIGAEDTGDFGAEWVGERASRPETTSGKIRLEIIPTHELYANPLASQKVVDDLEFDIVGWLLERVSRRFAVKQGTAFVSGDGSNKPEGLLTNADVSEVNTGDANLLLADGLIDIFYDLPEFYANNSTWLMKRSTVKAVRKFKDGDGQYLWQPGLAGGQPATLLGRPLREAIDMPTVSAGNFPIIFGDIRSAYTIVDRSGVTTLRDPFSSKPFIEYYTTMRTGGQVVLAEAIRKQKVSA